MHPLQQRDILLILVIRVRRHISGITIRYFPRDPCKRVPNALSASVFLSPTFNLVSSCCSAPEEFSLVIFE